MSFECIECGYSNSKWMGRCPTCNEWDTFSEIKKTASGVDLKVPVLDSGMENLSQIKKTSAQRIKSGLDGFDRILGGGAVEGAVILLGGPPGVGKSTMFLQLANGYAGQGKKVLFISGEENPQQLRIHADRLEIAGDSITVMGTGNLLQVEDIVDDIRPDIIFVDSIQAVVDPEDTGVPGSLKQVKKCGHRLTSLAKNKNVIIFISGQVTKQGDIAGPKVLEHMVDVVTYMDYVEGSSRIINAVKNRFGSCGDFLMYVIKNSGLEEVDEALLAPGDATITGQTISCIRIGARLAAVELQALAVSSYFEYPLRRTSGFSRERLLMLTAISEKHLGLKLSSLDLYLNVGGKNKVTERVCDLGVISSIYSSIKNIPISNDTMFMGEVGLNGEVKTRQDLPEMMKFALRNKYKKVIVSNNVKNIEEKSLEIVRLGSIKELGRVITG